MRDGGQAFPIWVKDSDYSKGGYVDGGMSLRDYLAAHALPGLLVRRWENDAGKLPENIHALWAAAAYKLADEMLTARDKPRGDPQ